MFDLKVLLVYWLFSSLVRCNIIEYTVNISRSPLKEDSVKKGLVSSLAKCQDIFKPSLIDNENSTWTIYRENGSWYEQSILIYNVSGGYNLAKISEAIPTNPSSNIRLTKTHETENTIAVETINYLYNIANSVDRLIFDFSAIISYILELVKGIYKETEIRSWDYHVLTKGSQTWDVALTTWKRGSDCDTALSWEQIEFALKNCVNDNEYEYKMAMCIRINHNGNCHSDIRIQRSLNPPFRYIWDIRCGMSDQNIIDMTTCMRDFRSDS